MHHDTEVERLYTSRAWRKSRNAKLIECGGLCEMCMSKGLLTPATQVHHKEHLTAENVGRPEIALDHANLIALCDECHAEQHRTKRWRCDALGHVSL